MTDVTNYYRCMKCKLPCDVWITIVQEKIASMCCRAPVEIVQGR